MTSMIPRFGAFLIPLVLAGCGLELWSPLKKLQTGAQGGGLTYSWPVDVTLPLGNFAFSLEDPSFARAILGDLALVAGDDERMRLVPAAHDLAPMTFAGSFDLDDPIALTLPPQAVKNDLTRIPDLNLPPIDLVASGVLGRELLPGAYFPNSVTYPYSVKLPLNLADPSFSEAQMGDPAGRFVFTLRNRLGVAFTPVFNLYATRQGVRRKIGHSLTVAPVPTGADCQIVIPLYAGSFFTRDLSLELDAWVQGGQTVSAPTDGLKLWGFALDDPKVSRIRVPLASQSLAFAPRLPLDLPEADLAPASVKSLLVETGEMRLFLKHGLPVPARYQLSFPGFFRPGEVAPLTTSFVMYGGESRTHTTVLDGVTIRPQDGEIAVNVSAETEATGPEGVLLAVDGSEAIEGKVTLGGPLRFRAIEVPLRRDVSLASSSAPVNLPERLKTHGVSLSDVALRIHLMNQSALSGAMALDVSAQYPGAPDRKLTDKQGMPVILPISPQLAQDLMVDGQNSNLLELLNGLPSGISFGGKVSVDSGGKPVMLTRQDQIAGRVTFEVPLSVTFPAMGPGLSAPPYDHAPKDLPFSEETRRRLELLDRAELWLDVENGWNAPFELDLRFSRHADPYADPEALVRTFSLGNAHEGYRVKNRLLLEGEDLERFRQAKKLGVRLRSPGSTTPVTIFRGAQFRLTIGVDFKAQVDSKRLGN